jgi:uronate dehydrogenase
LSAQSRAREHEIRNILITGAAGEIGSTLYKGLAGRYPLLRLADLRPIDATGPGEEAVRCDVTDPADCEQAMEGIDCVVHLAGVPREGPWDAILPTNIAGTYNVFEAARRQGVQRIVFASSNHVIGYYRAQRRTGIDLPPRPDSRYGLSKVFGEALGRLYADKHALCVACLRIGSFRPEPREERELATWISPRDMVELARCAIEAPDYHFVVVYGVSANTRNRWDNPDAARIGYVPRDDAEAYAKKLAGKAPPANDPAAVFHGGRHCSLEWSGDASRID